VRRKFISFVIAEHRSHSENTEHVDFDHLKRYYLAASREKQPSMKKLAHHITIAVLTTGFVATIATSTAQNWPGYLFDNGHSSYNASATAITPANASSLVQDWTFNDPQPTIPGQPIAGFYSGPTVVNGVVYIGSNTGNFYALDETTGAILWQQLLGFTIPTTCGRGHGVTSTATVATDPVSGALTVYVGGGDGYLYALDAATGNIVFRQFVADVGTTQNTGFIWASPTIVSGRIYLGWASQCDNPLVRSGIKSFDQHTGTLLKTFWTLPNGSTGAGVWSTAATDGNSIWITTGNGDAGGSSYAIVKLKASNLRFQTQWVPALSGDLDWGSSPTLFQATINNVRTKMVGANQKNGIFYALDANNLQNGPLWSFQVGTTEDFAIGADLAAPIWDSVHRMLFVAGNQTTINATVFAGSVRALNPANGSIIWERGLTGGPVMGSPTLNGGGVLAAGTYNIVDVTQNVVYLLDASNGNILTTIPQSGTIVFPQPVFADTHLFVANAGGRTSIGKLTAFTPSALKAAKK
jgi:outer membrane protein assembly factor BamB